MTAQNWARKHARGEQILTIAEQDEQIIHRFDGNIRDAYGGIQNRLGDLEIALVKAVDKLKEGEIFNLAELDLARIEYAGLAADMEIFIDAVFEYNTAINTRGEED